jgi:hypothetical protein
MAVCAIYLVVVDLSPSYPMLCALDDMQAI